MLPSVLRRIAWSANGFGADNNLFGAVYGIVLSRKNGFWRMAYKLPVLGLTAVLGLALAAPALALGAGRSGPPGGDLAPRPDRWRIFPAAPLVAPLSPHRLNHVDPVTSRHSMEVRVKRFALISVLNVLTMQERNQEAVAVGHRALSNRSSRA